jgi:hypothetical protein
VSLIYFDKCLRWPPWSSAIAEKLSLKLLLRAHLKLGTKIERKKKRVWMEKSLKEGISVICLPSAPSVILDLAPLFSDVGTLISDYFHVYWKN